MQKNWIYLRICLVIVDRVYDFILNGSIRNACCGVGQKKKRNACCQGLNCLDRYE